MKRSIKGIACLLAALVLSACGGHHGHEHHDSMANPAGPGNPANPANPPGPAYPDYTASTVYPPNPTSPANPPRPGWLTLIDGAHGMEHWVITGGANWHAAGGAIQADRSTTQGASVLVSKRSFRDFDLVAEFWAADETNSGIYLRAMNPASVSTATGAYEVQIWDRNPDTRYTTASLVNVAAVPPTHKAGGRWNTFEVSARGPRITVRFNGVQTVSANDGRFPEGRIGLQFNGGLIKFRRLMVRPL